MSRIAVAASLKKAFDAPDLAPDAEAGLSLAAKQAYNAIFLDVEMPGMDGFELCKRIRESGCNRDTPVVFVTRHSDFESRAKAALSGGQYLLGKPFLALEITVKALTLVWRSRRPLLEACVARGNGDTAIKGQVGGFENAGGRLARKSEIGRPKSEGALNTEARIADGWAG